MVVADAAVDGARMTSGPAQSKAGRDGSAGAVADFYQRATQNHMAGRGRIWTKSDLQRLGPVPISHVLRRLSDRASWRDGSAAG